ncbi:Protein DAP-3 [Aphelenchoides avenae]|nr:Protein DAP-3 [Aphelenchus avenae]
MDTLNECVWMCRTPLLEVINCLKAVRTDFPALRVVLWGKFGTGKSLTLQQSVHYAHSQQFVLVTVSTVNHNVLDWLRRAGDIQMSTYQPGRIDTPVHAVHVLQLFKQQNQHLWQQLSELKTSKNYSWSKTETTAQDKPITDIVEMGLSAPLLATDCVGALFEELRRHASQGSIKVLLAMDYANSLYGKTLIRRADRTYAQPEDVTLVQQFRKFFRSHWSNGACVLVADKAEIVDARDMQTVPLHTPLELFGEKGFEEIDPFIPVETPLYTEAEANAMHDYYKETRWLASERARTDEGRKELFYLSAFNPYHYERLCAFN